MDAPAEPTHPLAQHPAHALLMMATLPLFLGALLSDVAYVRTFEIQWANFASWLLAGGLFITSLALVAAIASAIHAPRRRARHVIYVVLLFATLGLGFVDILVHARDAWASMPSGVMFSLIVTVLAGLATGVAISGLCHACHNQGAAR